MKLSSTSVTDGILSNRKKTWNFPSKPFPRSRVPSTGSSVITTAPVGGIFRAFTISPFSPHVTTGWTVTWTPPMKRVSMESQGLVTQTSKASHLLPKRIITIIRARRMTRDHSPGPFFLDTFSIKQDAPCKDRSKPFPASERKPPAARLGKGNTLPAEGAILPAVVGEIKSDQ